MRTKIKTIRQNKLPIINGDLFQYIENFIHDRNNGSNIIVPHVCNNIDSFGAGFAQAVSKHYPIVKSNYHLLANKQILGYTQFVTVAENKDYGYKLTFANMIAQNGIIGHNNPRPLNYGALVKSMLSVSNFIYQNYDKDTPVQIHAPKFGCGLAGGDWSLISELIKDIWQNIPIYIYSYK